MTDLQLPDFRNISIPERIAMLDSLLEKMETMMQDKSKSRLDNYNYQKVWLFKKKVLRTRAKFKMELARRDQTSLFG